MADAVCMYALMLHELLIVRGYSIETLSQKDSEMYERIQDVFARNVFEGVPGQVRNKDHLLQRIAFSPPVRL